MTYLLSRLRYRSVVGVILTIVLSTMFALSAVLLAPAKTSHANPVTGAVFTTVDEAVDGTGHCQNGNPQVNCNIYDGKKYVWMNGGPVQGQISDGTYFFAVLDPILVAKLTRTIAAPRTFRPRLIPTPTAHSQSAVG